MSMKITRNCEQSSICEKRAYPAHHSSLLRSILLKSQEKEEKKKNFSNVKDTHPTYYWNA
jgi:hypothetical protein